MIPPLQARLKHDFDVGTLLQVLIYQTRGKVLHSRVLYSLSIYPVSFKMWVSEFMNIPFKQNDMILIKHLSTFQILTQWLRHL